MAHTIKAYMSDRLSRYTSQPRWDSFDASVDRTKAEAEAARILADVVGPMTYEVRERIVVEPSAADILDEDGGAFVLALMAQGLAAFVADGDGAGGARC